MAYNINPSKQSFLSTRQDSIIIIVLIVLFVAGIIFSLVFPFRQLFGIQNPNIDVRLELALASIAALTTLIAGINMLQIAGIKGKFWAPWKYFSYAMIIFSITNIANATIEALGLGEDVESFSAIGYISFPILFLIGVRKLFRMAGKKQFMVSFFGILLTIVIFLVVVIGFAQVFPPALGMSDIIPITIILAMFINTVVALMLGVKFVGGKLRNTYQVLAWSQLLIALGVSQEIFLGFIGHESEFSYLFIYKFHVGTLIYVGLGPVFIYLTMRAKRDVKEAYEAAVTTSSSSANPYAQIIDAIIQKFSTIIGKEIAQERLKKAQALDLDANGKIIIPASMTPEIAQHMIKEIVAAYKDLLGDASYQFVDAATKPILVKNPQIKLPMYRNK